MKNKVISKSLILIMILSLIGTCFIPKISSDKTELCRNNDVVTFNKYIYNTIEEDAINDFLIKPVDPVNVSKQTLTVGLKYNWAFQIFDKNGNVVDNSYKVAVVILDEEKNTIQQKNNLDLTNGNIWKMDQFIPYYKGTLLFMVENNIGKHEYYGNIAFDVDWATFEYNPSKLTAGIDTKDMGIEVYAFDAGGNIISEETFEMYNDSDVTVGEMINPEDLWAINSTGEIDLDENGMAMLWINYIGNDTGYYYAKLNGANTYGKLYVDYPNFEVNPTVIYVNRVNNVEVVAKDWDYNPLEGVNITFWPSSSYILNAPDPVETDENGYALLSLEPDATGTLNLSIARNIMYVNGKLNWTNLLTNTTLLVTAMKPLEILVSKSPIYQGETLTVTVLSGDDKVKDVIVQFGAVTKLTDLNGEVDFTVPDPGVDSAIYLIRAEKTGYFTATEDITVLKHPTINFIKDNMENTLTVVSHLPSNIPWNDIEITGNCNTSYLGEYVTNGDCITDCHKMIVIVHIPTEYVIAKFYFPKLKLLLKDICYYLINKNFPLVGKILN